MAPSGCQPGAAGREYCGEVRLQVFLQFNGHDSEAFSAQGRGTAALPARADVAVGLRGNFCFSLILCEVFKE